MMPTWLINLAIYVGFMLCVMAVVGWFCFRSKEKIDPYKDVDPDDITDEEKADRNFFKYIDKVNKDIDRI